MDINAILAWITTNKVALLGIAAAIYSVLSLIVKLCPTLDEGWLLNVIKFLAVITNRQTNDKAIRTAKVQPTK